MPSRIQQRSSAIFSVQVDGTELPDDVAATMTYAVVEDNLNLPDMFYLSFLDPLHAAIQKGGFTMGAAVKVAVKSEANPGGDVIFQGEVTALEAEFEGGKSHTVVRGFDKANRLYRGRHTRAFKDVKYDDVVKKVATEAGLQAGRIESPRQRPARHVSQANVSDADFLAMLAGEVGFVVEVEEGKVNFHAPPTSSAAPGTGDLNSENPLQLTLGDNLLRFNATVTSDSQVKEVFVRGWDVKTKAEVVGQAAVETTSASVGTTPAELAQLFGNPSFTAVDVPYGSTTEVDAAAKALAEQVAGSHAQLEGVARGNPKLRAGQAVSLGLVGSPFEGKYTLTVTRHVFDNGEYLTHFASTGRHERSLQSMTSGGASTTANSAAFVSSPIPGVVSALVTNVRDTADQIGQVKVKIPRLDPDFESDWLRVVQPGAGGNRGALVLPEVGDEVLVAFEHGDMRRGYVLGGVYNGVDKPNAEAYKDAVGGDGKVAKRSFTSRKGHFVLMSDKDGEEYVEIATAGRPLSVKLAKDTEGGAVLVTSNKVIKIDAGGDITITGKGKVTVESKTDLVLKGQRVTLEGVAEVKVKGAKVGIEATAQAELKGAQTKVAGTAMLDLDGGGIANLKAGLVKIN